MANEKTINLAGSEAEVKISGQNCDIRNDGTDTIYVSRKANVAGGADGVVSIPAGQAVKLLDTCGTVYLLGTGSVQLCGNDYGYPVFKTSATASGEGGGVDEAARNAINAHAGNTDIHLTTADVAECVSNPDLLINPNFKINQRGKTEYSAQGYTVDRWHIWNYGTVTVTDDGVTVTAGEAKTYFKQTVEENLDNMTMTLSVETDDGTFSATGTSDDVSYPSNKKVMGVAIGEADLGLWKNPSGQYIMQFGIPAATSLSLKNVKLEIGGIATPFTPPGAAVELLKCQRYYQVHTTGDIDPIDLRPTMAAIKDIKERSDGNYEYIAEL